MPAAPGRVLVVDDSHVIRQLIRINLELDGFEVMTAADGAECLEAVGQFRPDVITLDLDMPRLDGRRTVGRLRLDPRTGQVPLVLVSARTAPREVAAGVDAVVAKPFEPAELVALVRRLAAEGRPATVQLAERVASGPPAPRTLAP